jgi:glucarate dehydratase
MNRDVRITRIQVTPVAFRDGPLLNAAGIHEPWALRAILEVETSDGRVGISETYGDAPMLAVLDDARAHVLGLSPFALNRMEERLRAAIRPKAGAVEFTLAPGSHSAKNAAKAVSAFEVAMLDLQGQIVGAPIVDLLGGAVRTAVAYSAYLFFKYAEHHGKPYAPDAWGEGISPDQIVAQARQMIALYGFQSIKLKGGVFEPRHEIACIRALHEAFPGLPLRLDPNANWSLATSKRAAEELDDLLEYYEDPCPGLDGMAELARHTRLPLATNMVVTSFEEFRANAQTGGGEGGAVRPPLLGRAAGHPEPGGDVPRVGPGDVDAFQFAPGHQPDGDDPCGGGDPEPQPTPATRTTRGRTRTSCRAAASLSPKARSASPTRPGWA